MGSVANVTMASDGTMFDHESVSPVTLSSEWSRVARLLVMICLSVIGCIGNGYMISAVIVEEHLSKKGNSYVANVALADFLISGLVIPASAVIILAGFDDYAPVCHFQWFLAILCCLVTILTLMAVSIENYARLCLSPACNRKFTSTLITVSIIGIWSVSALLVSLQFGFKLGPYYCAKKASRIVPYQVIVAGLFAVIPIFVTIIMYSKILYRVRAARANPSFKPPIAFNWDYSLMLTNMYSFIMFILFWLPFWIILVVTSIKNGSAHWFYKLAWLALSRSCFNNILYCIANRHFQNAYINLFHYCCCKTTVSFSRRGQRDGGRPPGDVRVHIILGYNAYPYASPNKRCLDSSKKTAKRFYGGNGRSCTRSRSNDREVYQL